MFDGDPGAEVMLATACAWQGPVSIWGELGSLVLHVLNLDGCDLVLWPDRLVLSALSGSCASEWRIIECVCSAQ